MISELFLYDRDKGLFKEILKQSTVMQGRYHVSGNYGHDLNTANLEQYIKDPASGMSDVKQKWPATVLIAPKSKIIRINGQPWEEFYFHLYVLCLANRTGNNQIKQIDRDTNTSTHHTWYDWKDMKEVAVQFLNVLREVITMRSTDIPLRSVCNIDFDNAVISRLSKFNNDQVSGVGVSFIAHLYTGTCELTDYSSTAVSDITIPDFNIHQLHKH